jgi:glycerol-3-phosphate dehydrogenase
MFIIGGGINGAAVARDAVGRGFSVMLAEAEDYASATSSSSSKLIHGGLRYLETYEFGLVRESLHERETMLKIAPHICFPLRFFIPITRTQKRPAWLVRIGLLLYDFLSGARLLAHSGALSKAQVAALPRLKQDNLTAVLHYPDCWIDDARLVLSTLLDARKRGADILNYRRVNKITPTQDGYDIELDERGVKRCVHARYVVNAAGPWANEVLDATDAPFPRSNLRLVRGSHIVLKMPDPAEHDAYTLQSPDGRVIFTLPWLNSRYLIIGTTDTPQEEGPRNAKCSDEERDYLLKSYNRYFTHPDHPATEQDVVWTWAGVRPLIDDGEDNPSKVTRESRLALQKNGTGAFVTIYGGKLTTHRKLGEKVMALLADCGADIGKSWTASKPLYGGHFSRDELQALAKEGPDIIDESIRRRWVFTYGDETRALYEAITSDPKAAKVIAPGILAAELQHAAICEDVMNAEDFLYRRTKLFIDLDEAGRKAIDKWFKNRR